MNKTYALFVILAYLLFYYMIDNIKDRETRQKVSWVFAILWCGIALPILL